MTTETITETEPDTTHGAHILYRSDAIEIRCVPARDSGAWVVTFEPYHDDPGFERSGFGQRFFAGEGVSAIHVLSAGNDWYQYPEMDEALAAIRAALASAAPARVLAYGSSMGGYAAIRFADAIGATHVLALSPQYSIDRRRVPAEKRWYVHQQRLAFRSDYNGRIDSRADIVVAYDPLLKMDAAHIALIRRDIRVHELRLPHGGHPVAPFLNEVGLLQPLARDAVRGTLDVAAIEATAAARQKESASWLAERAVHLSTRRRRAAALDVAERALAMAPDNPTMLYQYGLRLHEARDYRAAADLHRRAVAGMPHPQFYVALSKALFFGGERGEALIQAEQVVALAPNEHVYVRWRGRVLHALGDHEGAARDYAAVWRLRPSLRALFGLVRRHARLGFERSKARLGLSRG